MQEFCCSITDILCVRPRSLINQLGQNGELEGGLCSAAGYFLHFFQVISAEITCSVKLQLSNQSKFCHSATWVFFLNYFSQIYNGKSQFAYRSDLGSFCSLPFSSAKFSRRHQSVCFWMSCYSQWCEDAVPCYPPAVGARWYSSSGKMLLLKVLV